MVGIVGNNVHHAFARCKCGSECRVARPFYLYLQRISGATILPLLEFVTRFGRRSERYAIAIEISASTINLTTTNGTSRNRNLVWLEHSNERCCFSRHFVIDACSRARPIAFPLFEVITLVRSCHYHRVAVVGYETTRSYIARRFRANLLHLGSYLYTFGSKQSRDGDVCIHHSVGVRVVIFAHAIAPTSKLVTIVRRCGYFKLGFVRLCATLRYSTHGSIVHTSGNRVTFYTQYRLNGGIANHFHLTLDAASVAIAPANKLVATIHLYRYLVIGIIIYIRISSSGVDITHLVIVHACGYREFVWLKNGSVGGTFSNIEREDRITRSLFAIFFPPNEMIIGLRRGF